MSRARAAIALAAALTMPACESMHRSFRPHYAGPGPIMQRLAAAARQCGYSEVRTGPPLLRVGPDEIGLRIEGMQQGRRFDCLLRWCRENGLDLASYRIIYDRAPE